MKIIILKLLTVINYLIPKKNNYIIFTSYPDLSDNSYALYEYMLKNYSNYYSFIWLVEPNICTNIKKLNSTKIVSKKSLLAFYYYCRSKYIFFTHGLYNGIKNPSSQIVVNLWHGMPLKNIGYLDNKTELLDANLTIATSSSFQQIMSKALKIPLDKVLISGQPRNQYLLDATIDTLKSFGINKQDYKQVIAWLPTYRKSHIGDIRTDGIVQELLPLVNKNELITLDSSLKEKKIYCFIKLHPMDTLSKKDFDTYTNIKVLTNEDFYNRSIQLYSFLSHTDALLTDYSSVYIDYMLTKKPMGFVIPDIEYYANNRGFVFDNVLEYLPGKIIQSFSQIELFIEELDVCRSKVSYLENGLYEFYHSVDNNFSNNLYKEIFKNENH
jgi:CDP-glycerol glycerophosphotransferase (TagB/SpsB family)